MAAQVFDGELGDFLGGGSGFSEGGEDFGEVVALQLQDHGVARAGGIELADLEAGRVPAGQLDELLHLAVGDVAGEVREEDGAAAGADLSPLQKVEAAQLLRGRHGHHQAATPRRVEAGPLQGRLDGDAHAGEEGEEGAGEELERRRHRVVGSPFEDQPGRTPGQHQGRQDGLQEERRRAGGADREVVIARRDGGRGEGDLPRADRVPFHPRPADAGRRLDGGQVLAHQPRPGAPGADVTDAHRGVGDHGERQGGAEDLPSALPARTVDVQHPGHVTPPLHPQSSAAEASLITKRAARRATSEARPAFFTESSTASKSLYAAGASSRG